LRRFFLGNRRAVRRTTAGAAVGTGIATVVGVASAVHVIGEVTGVTGMTVLTADADETMTGVLPGTMTGALVRPEGAVGMRMRTFPGLPGGDVVQMPRTRVQMLMTGTGKIPGTTGMRPLSVVPVEGEGTQMIHRPGSQGVVAVPGMRPMTVAKPSATVRRMTQTTVVTLKTKWARPANVLGM
jgi:hypothetical protein